MQSTLALRVRVDVDGVHLAAGETNPRVRLYATAPVTCRDLGRGVYEMILPSQCAAPDRAYIGVDLYTSVPNSDRCLCDVHSAYETADLYQLARAPRGTVLPLQLRNRCFADAALDAHKGTVRLVVQASATSSEAPPPAASADLAPLAQRMQQCMERGIATMQFLRPSDPLLEDVLAPCYTTRLMDLPGVAYWMVGVPLQESAAKHMLDVVLRRHDGLTREAFLALPPVDVAPLLVEFVTALPSSLPYIADKYPDARSGQLRPFESFDDLFIRKAGDCEDASRAVCALFNAVRFGTWRSAQLRHLQHTACYYAAFGVLGTIHGAGGKRLAHMHAELHPIGQFCARASLSLPTGGLTPLERSLPVLVGEATIHMCGDFSGTRRRSAPRDKQLQRELPRGYELERVQTWGARDSFYDLNAHMYTDFFFRLAREHGSDRPCPAFFSCLDGSTGTYGTAFGDRVSPVHVHARYSQDDVNAMRAVLAYNPPTPTLRAPRLSTTNKLVGAHPAPPDSGRRRCTTDVYCVTPDPLLRDIFNRVACTDRTNVVSEVFCAGYPPQQRVRIEWGT